MRSSLATCREILGGIPWLDYSLVEGSKLGNLRGFERQELRAEMVP